METTLLQIDQATSKVSFSVKKLGFITVKGTLSDFNSEITFDPADIAHASFDVRLSTITVNTGNEKRDEHLKSNEFFFVKEHPYIHFKSTDVQESNGQFKVIGHLTILEKTHEVEIPFDFHQDTFSGVLKINRLDYKLGTKLPTFVVSKNIQISIECKVM